MLFLVERLHDFLCVEKLHFVDMLHDFLCGELRDFFHSLTYSLTFF